ncbi:MAG: exodeoxyribonuclease III [Alphaproteobacteria bacterium]|nr:exodeoxyribonuclease III [Alphaproteobacteria bacterium]
MKIATLNINSVNARLAPFLAWLDDIKPDIVLLEEIKTEYNGFPFFEISAAGYEAKVLGQKGYNGVAVLSKIPVNVLHENLPNFEDTQARYLEVQAGDVVISSVYMPNGNPTGSEKFEYKLKFMDAFNEHAEKLLKQYDKVIFGGDFNVILSADDVYDETLFKDNALCAEGARRRLTALKYLGFYDVYKTLHAKENGYTYWDYGPTAFVNDFGMRIDFFFASASMIQTLKSCVVDKDLRKIEKPSDHTALVAEFEI